MIQETPGTLPQTANVPNYALQPREMKLSGRGVGNVPVSQVFPEIRGGTCEFCGTLDPNIPGQYQYKLCPHYRGMEMKCLYCPDHKDQDEVIRNTKLLVRANPYRPNELVTVCQSFECQKKFKAAFGSEQ